MEWGAISSVMASPGICLRALSKLTGCKKLLTKYSAEQVLFISELHFSSLMDVDIHLLDLSLGDLITLKIVMI